MSKIELVRKEMMNAMKEKNKPRKEALSLLLAALKNKTIDKRADLTEEEENAIILKEIKQAQETLESAPADRTEIIEECRTRMAVYAEFAPKQIDEGEIRATIEKVLEELKLSAPTPREKGLIMKNLMPLVKGKADGKLVNQLLSQYMK